MLLDDPQRIAYVYQRPNGSWIVTFDGQTCVHRTKSSASTCANWRERGWFE